MGVHRDRRIRRVSATFPQGVVASAFANRDLYVVLANYSHTPVEIVTADEYFSETSVAPARGKIWKLAARSFEILRRNA